jgi:hypothetical protein
MRASQPRRTKLRHRDWRRRPRTCRLWARDRFRASHAFVITDHHVAPLHANSVVASLRKQACESTCRFCLLANREDAGTGPRVLGFAGENPRRPQNAGRGGGWWSHWRLGGFRRRFLYARPPIPANSHHFAGPCRQQRRGQGRSEPTGCEETSSARFGSLRAS